MAASCSSSRLRETSFNARAEEWEAITGACESSIISMIASLEGWETSITIPQRFISATTSRPRSLRPPWSQTSSRSPVLESDSWEWPLWARDM